MKTRTRSDKMRVLKETLLDAPLCAKERSELETEKTLTTQDLSPKVVVPPGQTYEYHRQALIAVSLEMLTEASKVKPQNENAENDS